MYCSCIFVAQAIGSCTFCPLEDQPAQKRARTGKDVAISVSNAVNWNRYQQEYQLAHGRRF
jgi:hypothetical protein